LNSLPVEAVSEADRRNGPLRGEAPLISWSRRVAGAVFPANSLGVSGGQRLHVKARLERWDEVYLYINLILIKL